jgi:hypothetical protein
LNGPGCASEAVAAELGYAEVVAGINPAPSRLPSDVLDRGFRTLVSGVAMQRPNEPAFDRPDCFETDDLR